MKLLEELPRRLFLRILILLIHLLAETRERVDLDTLKIQVMNVQSVFQRLETAFQNALGFLPDLSDGLNVHFIAVDGHLHDDFAESFRLKNDAHLAAAVFHENVGLLNEIMNRHRLWLCRH